MPAQATAPVQKTDAAQARRLEFYRTRDDLVRAYQPATEEERLLVTQMAHAWITLQRAYELQARIDETTGLFELFMNDLERYKLLSRTIADGERMWRNAVQEFQRARRRRESTSFDSPRRRSLTTVASTRPGATKTAGTPVPTTAKPVVMAANTTSGRQPASGSLEGYDPPTRTRGSQEPPGN